MRTWLAFGLGSSRLVHWRVRRLLLRAAGASASGRVKMYSGARMIAGDPRNLTFEGHAFVNAELGIFGKGKVTIGDHVFMAPRVMILTGTHEIGEPERRAKTPTIFHPVAIGRGCWIGAGAIIQPGVTIGDGCVIAAGSVVTADCEPNGLYAGVPAERKKDLPDT